MAGVTFVGEWSEPRKQKVKDALAGIFQEYPQARVSVTDTGTFQGPYFADVWDGPAHKTVGKRIEVYTLDVLANHVRWRLEEGKADVAGQKVGRILDQLYPFGYTSDQEEP